MSMLILAISGNEAKASGVNPMTNTPIANALHRLSDDDKAKLEKKLT